MNRCVPPTALNDTLEDWISSKSRKTADSVRTRRFHASWSISSVTGSSTSTNGSARERSSGRSLIVSVFSVASFWARISAAAL